MSGEWMGVKDGGFTAAAERAHGDPRRVEPPVNCDRRASDEQGDLRHRQLLDGVLLPKPIGVDMHVARTPSSRRGAHVPKDPRDRLPRYASRCCDISGGGTGEVQV